MKFSQQHPLNVYARCVLLEEMKKLKPEDIHKVAPEFIIEYEEADENGNIFEIDWKFALFDATMFQLKKIFNNFVVDKKPKSEGDKIVEEVVKELEKAKK